MTIDREALIGRHAVRITEAHPEHVLTVGNGDFAYTADITGMQSFGAFHDVGRVIRQGGVAVNTTTMSSWGWHEMPNPEGFVLDDAMSEYQTARGPVLYPDRYDMEAAMRGTIADDQRAGAWLHVNPQRIDLGRIGLELRPSTGEAAETDPSALTDTEQRLDLWNGTIDSSFGYAGSPVTVRTVAAPDSASVAFRISSPLLGDGRARVVVRFPYAHDGFFQTDAWDVPEKHVSSFLVTGVGRARIDRRLDGTRYSLDVSFSAGTIEAGPEPHSFVLTGDAAELELVVRFNEGDVGSASAASTASFDAVEAASATAWRAFWQSGAALELSAPGDARAHELERRVVLSQYLTKVNCSGVTPPAETGLITNSWQGKFHLEMHFWHAAHFAVWGRPELLERSLQWYRSILPEAKATAARQGYPGVRWPKHVGPDGRESPSPIGSLLVWQQPHVLYMLELVWNASSADARRQLLVDFGELIAETATFMAAFPEQRDGTFHLGPPVMPAQEFYDARTTEDPTFELAYWWWGLEIAQRWQERAGLDRREDWQHVVENLATPRVEGAVGGDRYAAVATGGELRRDDHPSLLMALGVVPQTPLIDAGIMQATLLDVLANWEWPSAWGWDFPVLAMTAVRSGRADLAIDALLRDEAKNRYTLVGHNPQMGGILPIYLPANGALLSAVALMVDSGAFEEWDVAAEGFTPWP